MIRISGRFSRNINGFSATSVLKPSAPPTPKSLTPSSSSGSRPDAPHPMGGAIEQIAVPLCALQHRRERLEILAHRDFTHRLAVALSPFV